MQETPRILHLKQKILKFSGHFLLLNLFEMTYLPKIAWFASTFQKSNSDKIMNKRGIKRSNFSSWMPLTCLNAPTNFLAVPSRWFSLHVNIRGEWYSSYKAVRQIPVSIIISYKKCFFLVINTIIKFLRFRIKYIIDGGFYLIIDTCDCFIFSMRK